MEQAPNPGLYYSKFCPEAFRNFEKMEKFTT